MKLELSYIFFSLPLLSLFFRKEKSKAYPKETTLQEKSMYRKVIWKKIACSGPINLQTK